MREGAFRFKASRGRPSPHAEPNSLRSVLRTLAQQVCGSRVGGSAKPLHTPSRIPSLDEGDEDFRRVE
jgi:hypothetical protein